MFQSPLLTLLCSLMASVSMWVKMAFSVSHLITSCSTSTFPPHSPSPPLSSLRNGGVNLMPLLFTCLSSLMQHIYIVDSQHLLDLLLQDPQHLVHLTLKIVPNHPPRHTLSRPSHLLRVRMTHNTLLAPEKSVLCKEFHFNVYDSMTPVYIMYFFLLCHCFCPSPSIKLSCLPPLTASPTSPSLTQALFSSSSVLNANITVSPSPPLFSSVHNTVILCETFNFNHVCAVISPSSFRCHQLLWTLST